MGILWPHYEATIILWGVRVDGLEKVVKHLEMTQGIINRLANNSFLLKGWSMTLVVAATLLMTKYDIKNPFIVLAILFPICNWPGDPRGSAP